MMRRQIAVALTGIIAGNTVLFAHAAATTETQSERTADRYMIIDLAGIPFTWTDESLTEIQVSEAVSTEFEDFSEGSLEAEEPPYYMSLTSLDNEYIEHLDQFDSLKNSTDPIDMYTGSQMTYAVSDIRTDESIISYLLDQYAGYDTYSAVEFYEVASLKPADENGIYSLLLQQEEENADVVHYSVADGTLQKSAVEAVLNEYGQPSYSLETTTNHWMIVHLVSKVPAEGQDTVQTEEKETDEEASRSLEGALEEDNADPTGSSRKDSQTSDYAAATSKSSSETKETKLPEASTTNVPETQKPAQTKPATTKPAQTTKVPETAATVAPTAASTTSPTTAPSTAAPTTSTPTTAAHTHTWVPVTTTVHHDAVTSQVWKEDTAAWDETVVTKAAWDEQVLSQAAYDEQVLVQAAYDEPVYSWLPVCNVCGYQFPLGTTGDQLEYHIFYDPGCGGGWHDVQVQTGSVHHDAVYQTVHHDAVYNTVHHEAETTVVHHEATGHYETVVTQAAWDETVTTGYKCSGCGATK